MDGKTDILDRDIIVLFSLDTASPANPSLVVERSCDGSTVVMISIMSRFEVDALSMEAVFSVDSSGSMTGQSILLSMYAVLFFLHSLPSEIHIEDASNLLVPHDIRIIQKSLDIRLDSYII